MARPPIARGQVSSAANGKTWAAGIASTSKRVNKSRTQWYQAVRVTLAAWTSKAESPWPCSTSQTASAASGRASPGRANGPRGSRR